MKSKTCFLLLLALLLCAFAWPAMAQQTPVVKKVPLVAKPKSLTGNKPADLLYQQGNYAQALEIYEKQATAPNSKNPHQSLSLAAACLKRLNRIKELDNLLIKAVAAHPDNWQVLQEAASIIFQTDHSGYLIAGDFVRGPHRGGGQYADAFDRDRVQALQWMERAMPLAIKKAAKSRLGNFYLQFARMVLVRASQGQAWKLTEKTGLTDLPDPEPGDRYWGGHYGGQDMGAPVDENGTPVFYTPSPTWEAAQNDGERWRFLLAQAAKADPSRQNDVWKILADFLRGQFGVQTLAGYPALFAKFQEADRKMAQSVWYLPSLTERETLARLATGPRRFSLPPAQNFILYYYKLVDAGGSHAREAMDMLAGIYTDRLQFDRAAQWWGAGIKEYGDSKDKHRQKKLDQIVKPWGRFDPTGVHPAGKKAQLDFVFRNARKVSFTATRVKVDQLLQDVRTYLESNPKTLDWQKTSLENLGHRLVTENQKQYLGRVAAQWTENLSPRPGHWDRRKTLSPPDLASGAYLVTAKVEGGNTSSLILWIADTVLIERPMKDGQLFIAADADTGEPVANASLDFFGWRQNYIKKQGWKASRPIINTKKFGLSTDKNGLATATSGQMDPGFQWSAIARTPRGRLAYLGFSHVWYSSRSQGPDERFRSYLVTDRPVYRPGQKVHFKAWTTRADYELESGLAWAQSSLTVKITNPKNEVVFEKILTTDQWGGLEGDLVLGQEADLGRYRISTPHGSLIFRVEEYKKPEFEVSVQAPEKPVALGDTFEAVIRAKYYFGQPVTQGQVKYKVTRTRRDATWYPPAPWDWLYGPGYWWFGQNHDWYPGWATWGWSMPRHLWLPPRHEPPETVASAVVPIGPDGTVKVKIDTSFAKALFGDQDHEYKITAQVTDESRRTIVGRGSVIAAKQAFKVCVWADQGYFRPGDEVRAQVAAISPTGSPVEARGAVRIYSVGYRHDGTPVETTLSIHSLATDAQGKASYTFKAGQAGQYRVAANLEDEYGNKISGGYLFCVRGQGVSGEGLRFNALELVPDKKEYAPGEKVNLLVAANQPQAQVYVFIRPQNRDYPKPLAVKTSNKSRVLPIPVKAGDQPNFFVEALTVVGGKVYTVSRQIVVPPQKRVLNVAVVPGREKYAPGQEARVKIRVTDPSGEPVQTSLALAVYDRALEYISGGPNTPEIKNYFWGWKRRHYPSGRNSLDRRFSNLTPPRVPAMENLGTFGHLVADKQENKALLRKRDAPEMMAKSMPIAAAAPMKEKAVGYMTADEKASEPPGGGEMAEPAVRENFADTAFWAGGLTTNEKGEAVVSFPMPENLTDWKMAAWAMGRGTRVGQGEAFAVTFKNLLVRLQAPRFLVETDQAVISTNIHNYLDREVTVQAELEASNNLSLLSKKSRRGLDVPKDGEGRLDWLVEAKKEGEAFLVTKALTRAESDAMKLSLPVYVHGMEKMEAVSRSLGPDQEILSIAMSVPGKRREEETRLVVQFSPTLAGAMVDALPYMANYPYGCTEQTLNRFLPSVLTQRVLQKMGVDLKDIQDKKTNLNAQELGASKNRAAGWKQYKENPVFDQAKLNDMVNAGIERLVSMQVSDGGWGWFSGWGERSYPHTTALVVRGLLIARQNDVKVPQDALDRGLDWLAARERQEIQKLQNGPARKKPYKTSADNTDALVFHVLAMAQKADPRMGDFLYRHRAKLSVYGLSLLGLGLEKTGKTEQLAMVLQNISQYLRQDKENQTAWLELGAQNYWWRWYGDEMEATAAYLKLLSAAEPQSRVAAGLAKYLVSNRKHATYWNSTRDTAWCVEALAEYMMASGEAEPDMTVEILVDGKKHKQVRVTKANLFSFDNRLELAGSEVSSGKHTITIKKTGACPLYANAYLSYFTLEDFITKAGLEIKVNRNVFRLKEVQGKASARDGRGQAAGMKTTKHKREKLSLGDTVTSGDLLEVELVLESKNDYEYVVITDYKAAGTEPVDLNSGYNGNALGAYVEFRDERTAFFVRRLARGKHSVSYRLRAEIPGQYSALPARAAAMYAPELKANSDEMKLKIQDSH